LALAWSVWIGNTASISLYGRTHDYLCKKMYFIQKCLLKKTHMTDWLNASVLPVMNCFLTRFFASRHYQLLHFAFTCLNKQTIVFDHLYVDLWSLFCGNEFSGKIVRTYLSCNFFRKGIHTSLLKNNSGTHSIMYLPILIQ